MKIINRFNILFLTICFFILSDYSFCRSQMPIEISPNIGKIKQLTSNSNVYWPRVSPELKKIVFYFKDINYFPLK